MKINQTYQLTFTDALFKPGPLYVLARFRMAFVLAFTDAFTLLVTSAIILFLWTYVRSDLMPGFYVDLLPLLLVFLAVYFLSGLYSPSGLSPVEELQKLSSGTTIVFLGLGSLSFLFRNAESYSRAAFLLVWLVSLALLPTMRNIVRKVCTRYGWWGEPVAIIGMGEQSHEVLKFLKENPRQGYKPVVFINGFTNSYHSPDDLPVLHVESLSDQSAGILRSIRTVILVQPDIPEDFLHEIIEEYGFRFSQLILISNAQRFGSLWVTPCDFGGLLGLRIHQNLVSSWQQFIKRLLDIGFVVALSPIMIPLTIIIAILVRLDSNGSVFFSHTRIGRNGRRINVWKFRTMVIDGDEILAEYLEHNPDSKEEWLSYQKLKHDPRVTRVGQILRRFSLDELPQMWNILKGEMSVVGPRPIIDEEIKHYGSRFRAYLQVKPGLTGLWQISGRNNLDYQTRIRLDDYYVRNWSIWYDLYIIAHTPTAMITGKGAY